MEKNSTKRTERRGLPGVRYVFAGCGFLGFCTIYAIRVNINVAIVAMVNATAVYSGHNVSRSYECPAPNLPFGTNGTAPDADKEGEFVWTPNMQGVILGAFYYGYCLSQVPGGRLAEVFSGKWVFGLGTLATALLTLITPLAARWHVGLLITVRALEGLAQGVTMPAMNSMLGRWLPDSEKAILSTVVYGGINVGTVAAMPLAGALCNSDFLGGWPSAFYVIGIFGCCWFVLWCLLVTDTPLTHPFITNKEIKYIVANQKIDLNKELPPIPWLKIAKSVPFWALLITQIGQDWCFYTIVNDLPTYFATILHFDIEKNGFLSSFPSFLSVVMGLVAGLFADMIIRRGIATTGFVRKFCQTIGSLSTAVGLVGMCVAGCDAAWTVACVFFSVGMGGLVYSGYMLTALDMSPEYAGTLLGIANTVSNLTGFLVPLMVGSLTEKHQTLEQWRYVFGVNVLFMLVSMFVFLFFASSQKQDWLRDEDESTQQNVAFDDDEDELTPAYGTVAA